MERHFLDNLWRWKCGLPEKDPMDKSERVNLDDLRKSEWSARFERLMRNRLVLGAIRYGKLNEAGKPQYDRVNSVIQRLLKYKESGNKEFLVDAANLCLLEFEECHHPNAHFKAVDEHDFHTKAVTQ